MVEVRAFKGVRANPESVEKIAELPYDVYSGDEARNIVLILGRILRRRSILNIWIRIIRSSIAGRRPGGFQRGSSARLSWRMAMITG